MNAQSHQGGHATAKSALQLLLDKETGYRPVSATERLALAASFAGKGFVIYGKAFDAVHIDGAEPLELTEAALRNPAAFDRVTLIEVKSTNRTGMAANFKGYFFSLSTAELLVAQNLQHRYKFAFVNTVTNVVRIASMTEVLAAARAVYPTWSISLSGFGEVDRGSGAFDLTAELDPDGPPEGFGSDAIV